MRRPIALLAVLLAALMLAIPVATPANHRPQQTGPTATGTGGAAATVDETATSAAIKALRHGANAVDAAVVAAGVLGVTEPYSCGIGGGGFMNIYLAADGRVRTIDSRETAPEAMTPTAFVNPATGTPIPDAEAFTSGLGVGVPGTVRGWTKALSRYGTWSLGRALKPAIHVARRGFTVDETFAGQTEGNAARFADFTSTSALFLDADGTAPDVGSTFRNPDLARTYELLARFGPRAFYEGDLARAIVDAVRTPPLRPGATRTVRPGLMTLGDLSDYEARVRRPTRIGYRGLDVYGMAPPSSGGSTVGEILNILEGYDLGAGPREQALHRFLEASRLAYADRGAYLGDPEFFDVPLPGLLSDTFAAERRALITDAAAKSPVPAGNPYDDQSDPSPSGPPAAGAQVARTGSTTHLTVSDSEGNVVSYTFTIEQIGGSAITVPGYGFLLNNELTDFNLDGKGANAPEPGKRPRSSISPTIVLRDGKPFLALGAPGGSAIITAVAQVLLERLDLGAGSLPAAIARPRISQRNRATTDAERGFLASPEAALLQARGHVFTPVEALGLIEGIEFLDGGRVIAAAEPERRGGGSAAVEHPDGR